MKKAIASFLAVMLLLSLAPAAMAEEPIVVTMAFTGTVPSDAWKESNELKLLEEELNIRLDYSFYDDDKFALLLASGNMPDIIMPRQKHLATIIDNGLALNLDPLLETYAPNLAGPAFSASNSLSRQMLGGENRIEVTLYTAEVQETETETGFGFNDTIRKNAENALATAEQIEATREPYLSFTIDLNEALEQMDW